MEMVWRLGNSKLSDYPTSNRSEIKELRFASIGAPKLSRTEYPESNNPVHGVFSMDLPGRS